METAKLKKFAQFARRSLIEQVSAKLNLVLAEGSAARREQPKAIADLEKQLQEHDREQVIERIAYTWFNRFCALRFMDVNRYTRIGVVSPAEGQFQPEILAEAKMGHIDEEMVSEKIRQQIFALLNGTAPSRDPQSEAYRLLVVAACNDFHRVMPYLFERIADFTELLMPDDLLSGNSILAYTRETMTPDACGDVEVIGWLYQFYIRLRNIRSIVVHISRLPTSLHYRLVPRIPLNSDPGYSHNPHRKDTLCRKQAQSVLDVHFHLYSDDRIGDTPDPSGAIL